MVDYYYQKKDIPIIWDKVEKFETSTKPVTTLNYLYQCLKEIGFNYIIPCSNYDLSNKILTENKLEDFMKQICSRHAIMQVGTGCYYANNNNKQAFSLRESGDWNIELKSPNDFLLPEDFITNPKLLEIVLQDDYFDNSSKIYKLMKKYEVRGFNLYDREKKDLIFSNEPLDAKQALSEIAGVLYTIKGKGLHVKRRFNVYAGDKKLYEAKLKKVGKVRRVIDTMQIDKMSDSDPKKDTYKKLHQAMVRERGYDPHFFYKEFQGHIPILSIVN
jgi:hypothetical protein